MLLLEKLSMLSLFRKKESLAVEEVRDFCAKHLAKYKIPTIIEFIDELPKNTTGKILRRSLRDRVSSS